MRKYCCIPVLTCLGLTVGLGSQTASAQVISEGFDNLVGLTNWVRLNNSTSPNTAVTWFQGNTAAFVAQAGASNAYAATNYQSVSTGTGTCNTWLLTPTVSLVNGQVLKFWTRDPSTAFPDRMQVRMSLAGASQNIGTAGSPLTVGDFTTLLLDINPTYSATPPAAYPTAWTQFTVNVSGVASPTNGRLAFRYFVENGGPTGANSNYIGVDTVTLSGPPTCSDPLHACAADVAASSGVPGQNGTVNIDDLVLVITTWGNDNSSSNGPRPPADCAPGANGDCRVNIDDLVKIITAWGDCKGACCLANGSCVGNQTTTQCSAAGGTYKGDDVLCANVICPVAPANDLCANSAAAVNGANAFNNIAANTDGPAVSTSCAPAPGGTRDVWFHYTATCNGHVTFDTLATPTPLTDTIIQVFNTNACQGPLLGCGDDVSTSNLLSSLTVDLTSGQIVKVRVMSWGTDAANQGAGVLNIACVPLNNDACSDATQVAIPSSTNGNLCQATQDTAPLCNGVAVGAGRWYKVTGNGNILTACTCDSPLEGWDARLSVYCGSSCGNLTCVAASGTLDCGGSDSGVPGCTNIPASTGFGLQENVTWCSANNQTYWILVHSDSVPSCPDGNYNLKVSSGSACANAILCFTPGDDCETAGSLPALVVGNNSGSNVNMTTSNVPAPTCVGAGLFSEDVWRTFTPASTNTYTLTLCSSTPVFDSVMAVYSGSCASLVQVGCDDDGCGTVGALSVVSVSLNGGQTYLVRVGTWGADPQVGQTWTLNISIPAGCGTCTGTAEGAPVCQADGTPTANDPNGGCGSSPFAFPQTVTVGTTICGSGNYYTTGGSGFRDTDWYLFTPVSDGKYRVTICSDFPSTVRVYRSYDPTVTTCATCTGQLAAVDALAPALTPTDVDRTLQAGVTYAIFIAPQVGLGTLACSNYRMTVTSQGACPAWAAPGGAVAGIDTLCHANGDVGAASDPDGGCNRTPTAYDTLAVGGPAKTGFISTFISSANACTRDIDWYQFTVGVSGNFTLTVSAENSFAAQVLTGSAAPGIACGTLGVVTNSSIGSSTCGTVTSPAMALTSGTQYVAIVTTGYFFGQPCLGGGVGNRYWIRIQ